MSGCKFAEVKGLSLNGLTLMGLIDAFCELLARHGFTVTPYRDEDWAAFATLPEQSQLDLIAGLRAQLRFLHAADTDKIRFKDDKSLLRYSLNQLNISHDPGVYSLIETGDIIEVLDHNFIQVFRNLSFFDLCNYSLLELLVYPWYQLYERSELMNQKISQLLNDVIERQVPLIQVTQHIPPHPLRELRTKDRKSFLITDKYYCLLKDGSGTTSYALTIKKVTPIPEADRLNQISYL